MGSWATSQQIPEPANSIPLESLTNATLRQIVHLSVGGPAIRVRVSNAFGTVPPPTAARQPHPRPSTRAPISISTTTQLKAIAAAPDYANSPVAIGNYTVAAVQPIISPPTGHYTGPQTVTITDATPGAVIYYTTGGSTPNLSWPAFNPAHPIIVTSSQIIKTLARSPDNGTSPEGAASYTITP